MDTSTGSAASAAPDVTADVQKVESEIASVVADLQKRVTELESSTAAADAQGRVIDLENRIAAFNQRTGQKL